MASPYEATTRPNYVSDRPDPRPLELTRPQPRQPDKARQNPDQNQLPCSRYWSTLTNEKINEHLDID